MMDLTHAFHHTWRSLSDIQTLVLAGKFGNKPGCLKPLDNLKVADLRKELQTRGVQTQGMLKPQLLSTLTDILQGAQRVPTLLTLYPTQPLSSLNLNKYEVLDCEPLHDLKGHLYNLLPEIPNLLQPPLSSECQLLLDTTLPKQKVSGAFLRVAAIKLLIKLQNHSIHVDKLLLALLNTIVRVSELLYSYDQIRSPKTILQLYNVTWYHHELCCHFLSNPKHQSRSHLFGIYLHDLVAHAPPIYQLVCLRSMNAESQESLFSQAKHIGLKATSRKPENILPTILICMQARQKAHDCEESVHKQDSMVSATASKVGEYRGTFITNTFIMGRLSSWQAHLMRISSYVKHGEGIWWQKKEDGFKFNDSADDPDFHPNGPHLDHFRSSTLPDVYCKMSQDWDSILQERVELPSPSIRFYNADGNYEYSTSSLSLPSSFAESLTTSNTAQQTSLPSSAPLETTPHHPQTSSLSPTELHATPHQPQSETSSLSPTELQPTLHQPQNSSLSPTELHATPHQPQSETSSLSPTELQPTLHQPQNSSLSPTELHATPHQPQSETSSLSPTELQPTLHQPQNSSLSPTELHASPRVRPALSLQLSYMYMLPPTSLTPGPVLPSCSQSTTQPNKIMAHQPKITHFCP